MQLAAACVFSFVLAAPLQMALGTAGARAEEGRSESAKVTKVVDGDTIDVLLNGRHERVRLIGIDAPEKAHHDQPAEPLADQSTAFARRLANGETVTLEADALDDDRDKYGRLLRYVDLPDGRCLNAEILRAGYARAYTRFRFSRSKEFRAYEKEAKSKEIGLWAPH